MAAANQRSHLTRYLPHVLLATFSVAIAPLLAVYTLERYGIVTSSFAATAVGIGLSVGLARAGTWLWMRHAGSRDLVFGDLMLWGWVRRVRNEKRMNDARQLLGIDGEGGSVGETKVTPKRQGEVLRELASSIERGDPFTHGHTRRVTRYSYMLAKTMRLPKETVSKIRAAAAVHDVGKVDIPSEILNKPGRLTDAEFDIMKRHSSRGAEMVARLGDPEITAMVRHHHERIDGRGYPDNLKSEDIPLGARVIAVADTFDAIISTRPYRAARSHKEGIEILKRAAGTQLDEEAVEAFMSYYGGRKPLAWWLSVSTGVQRILGGFGGWLQHAKAASFTQGATSLGATIALTTAMATVAPSLGVGQHSGPALPKEKATDSIVADAGNLGPSLDLGGSSSVEAHSAPAAPPHGDEPSDSSDNAPAPEKTQRSDDLEQQGSSGSSNGFVAQPASQEEPPAEEEPVPPADDSDDDSGDSDDFVETPDDDGFTDAEPSPDTNGNGNGNGSGKDKDKKCNKKDPDGSGDDGGFTVAEAGVPSDSDDEGGDKDKGKDKSNYCKGSKDKDDKDEDDKDKDDKDKDDKDKDDKDKDDHGKPGDDDDDDVEGPGPGHGKGDDDDDNGPGSGHGNGNGGGHGKGDDDSDGSDEDGDVVDIDGDVPVDDGSEVPDGSEGDVVAGVEAPEPEVVEPVAPESETPVEETETAPVEEIASPPVDATVPVVDDEE